MQSHQQQTASPPAEHHEHTDSDTTTDFRPRHLHLPHTYSSNYIHAMDPDLRRTTAVYQETLKKTQQRCAVLQNESTATIKQLQLYHYKNTKPTDQQLRDLSPTLCKPHFLRPAQNLSPDLGLLIARLQPELRRTHQYNSEHTTLPSIRRYLPHMLG